jgi:hypothetical protein
MATRSAASIRRAASDDGFLITEVSRAFRSKGIWLQLKPSRGHHVRFDAAHRHARRARSELPLAYCPSTMPFFPVALGKASAIFQNSTGGERRRRDCHAEISRPQR